MRSIGPIRRTAFLFFLGSSLASLGGSLAFAQSPALPATRPTSSELPAGVLASTQATAPTSAPTPGHRAEVVYAQGQLKIAADNSSLNQILRDISRQTGMKITGGVIDQRVFGNYGPAAPADILASLLNGTGSNMLLKETASNAPEELILTPRQGGATPPNPNASGLDDDAQSGPQPNPLPNPSFQQPSPVPAPMPAAASTGPATQTPRASSFVSAQAAVPEAQPDPTSTPNPPPADTTEQTSPNGVKTPQQIYQQLQQLQSQQSTNPK